MIRKLRRFFWWLAGAELSLLERCPEDWHRFTAIGMSVMIVWCLALISGTFFFTETFRWPIWPAAGAGVGIGVTVLTVDRTVLCHFVCDKHRFRQLFSKALIAVALALSIGHALLLKIFEGSIDSYLHHQTLTAVQNVTEGDPAAKQLESITDELAALKNRLATAQTTRDQAAKVLIEEQGGIKTDHSSGTAGKGEQYQKKADALKAADQELTNMHSEVDGRIEELQAKVPSLTEKISGTLSEERTISDAAGDLIGRSRALVAIMATEPLIVIVVGLLFVVLLGIDTTPITQRLLGGPLRYDLLRLEAQKAAQIEFDKKKIFLDASAEVFRRIISFVSTGEIEKLKNPRERDFAEAIHFEMLRRPEGPSPSESPSLEQRDDREQILFEIADDPDGPSARVFVPSNRKDSLTLADLAQPIREFTAEASNHFGHPVRFTEASNSDGEIIDQHFLPLRGQLLADQRVLLSFTELESKEEKK